jgi:hypothetical protein
MTATVETARSRRRLASDAGMGTTSFSAVLAGTLVALGAVALVMAVVGAVGSTLGLSTGGISTDRWRQAGIGGTVVAALVLFGAFWFGGYTAGRMGRRAGFRHGLLVFLLAVVAIGGVAILAAAFGDPGSVTDRLSSNGVPTDANTWSDIGLGAAIAAVVATFLGAVLGGIQGDRWHGKLMTAAVAHRRDELERGEGETADHTARPRWYQRRQVRTGSTASHDASTIDVRDRPAATTAERSSIESERADHTVDR